MLDFSPSSLSPDIVDQYTWCAMPVRESPSSHDYLSYAKLDLHDGDTSRHLVNSMSNVKRALHLRLEDLCLGFGSVSLKKVGSFPELLKYVQRCGIVAPNVLHRLNSLRNDVEHRYRIPGLMEVKTFIDVTDLFLCATDRWRDRQPCDADYFQEVQTNIGTFCITGLSFDWKNGVAKILYRAKDSESRTARHSIDYSSDSESYFECVRFLLTNNY